MLFLDSVIAINNDRTKTIANKIKKVLKKKKRIILVGITFKKGTDDLRDSPSLKLLKELLKYNFEIGIYDEMYKKKPKYDILTIVTLLIIYNIQLKKPIV